MLPEASSAAILRLEDAVQAVPESTTANALLLLQASVLANVREAVSDRLEGKQECELQESSAVVPPVLTYLHEEILQHAAALDAALAAQEPRRGAAVTAVQQAASSLWPCAFVQPFGSMYGPAHTRLALTTSDVDLVVCGLPPRACSDLKLLGKLHDMLSSMPQIQDCKVVENRSNLCVLRLTAGGILVDIMIDSPTQTCLITSERSRRECERLPLLRPLVLVVKQMLHRHRLNDSFSGGLCGYATMLLCLRHLLDHPKEADLGLLLRGMLKFFGEQFDPHTMGIRARAGESYIICSEGTAPWGNQHLFIEDPQQRGNNVGKTSWRFRAVQKMFAAASQLLEAGSLHELQLTVDF